MSTSPPPLKKSELLSAIADSRDAIKEHRQQLTSVASARTTLRLSFIQHRELYLGAAVLLGLLLSKYPSRRATPSSLPYHHQPVPVAATKDKSGIAAVGIAVAKLAFEFVKPMILRRIQALQSISPQQPVSE